MILGSYFWGYLATSLLGGMLAEWFGGRHVIGWTMILSIISTIVVPFIASWGCWWVAASRFATGAFAGPVYPALHTLISRWAPPDEKGKFVATLMGGTFGTVITWPLVGVIIESLGWAYSFYIPAIISTCITVLWYYIVADSPAHHTRINTTEREYIEKELGSVVSKEKVSSGMDCVVKKLLT